MTIVGPAPLQRRLTQIRRVFWANSNHHHGSVRPRHRRRGMSCQLVSLGGLYLTPSTQVTPAAETSRTGVLLTSRHGSVPVSYSTTSYLLPQLRQFEHGATVGGWFRGTSARRRSSAVASSKEPNSPCGYA